MLAKAGIFPDAVSFAEAETTVVFGEVNAELGLGIAPLHTARIAAACHRAWVQSAPDGNPSVAGLRLLAAALLTAITERRCGPLPNGCLGQSQEGISAVPTAQVWDREAIKAAVRRKGKTLTALAIEHGLDSSACRSALTHGHARAEEVIASFLGVPASQLWPDRYEQGERRNKSKVKQLRGVSAMVAGELSRAQDGHSLQDLCILVGAPQGLSRADALASGPLRRAVRQAIRSLVSAGTIVRIRDGRDPAYRIPSTTDRNHPVR